MGLWMGTSLKGLYDSVAEELPATVRRRHSTHDIRIKHVDWVNFKGFDYEKARFSGRPPESQPFSDRSVGAEFR